MQLEEALHLFAFSSSAAHQQVTELVYWPQFLEDMTPLQDSEESTLSMQIYNIVLSRYVKMEHCTAVLTFAERRTNFCGGILCCWTTTGESVMGI